ncbi:MAG: serine/threonine protein kinase [Lentisphaerae bacterium]|nr:serine/threonine protein kinase [Lentisphaerota bacterium]
MKKKTGSLPLPRPPPATPPAKRIPTPAPGPTRLRAIFDRNPVVAVPRGSRGERATSLKRVIMPGDRAAGRMALPSAAAAAAEKRRRTIAAAADGAPPPAGRLSASDAVKRRHFWRDQGRVGKDRYRLDELVAMGGYGRVYRARDVLIDIRVAIKILNAAATRDAGAALAFRREARAAMQLSHPNVVRLYNVCKSGAVYFLVMEFVEGYDLRNVLRQLGPLTPEKTARVIEGCAEGMGHAHRRGVLHNDLKPENLMIDPAGVVKVIDFGIATLKRARADAEHVEGTPAYMSPEQLRGDPLDARSDQFALAVIACELLTGEPPFSCDESVERQLAARAAVELRGVPEAVAGVLARALHPEPARRWESVTEFAAALSAAARGTSEAGPVLSAP